MEPIRNQLHVGKRLSLSPVSYRKGNNEMREGGGMKEKVRREKDTKGKREKAGTERT